MDMQKMLFKIFTKKVKIHSSVFLFPISNIAGYWEEVLITDICYIKTTSKRRRWICSFPKQKSPIISLTQGLLFQEVISLTAIALIPSELPLGHLRDSLINGHPYKPNS